MQLVALLRSAAVALSIVGTLVCQFPCNSSPAAPAFFITCPCNTGAGDLWISVTGQGRIGTVQQIYTGCDQTVANFFCIGTQSVAPTPIPPGIAVCSNPRYTNIPSLNIDPLFVYTFMGPQPAGTIYWLMIPNDPQLVGVTIAAQSFNQQAGAGAAPFYASPLLGLTIAQ
jgi:hypothetical protein